MIDAWFISLYKNEFKYNPCIGSILLTIKLYQKLYHLNTTHVSVQFVDYRGRGHVQLNLNTTHVSVQWNLWKFCLWWYLI